jgi:heme/copper-type cytochrome/quinol oxidase subunit 2
VFFLITILFCYLLFWRHCFGQTSVNAENTRLSNGWMDFGATSTVCVCVCVFFLVIILFCYLFWKHCFGQS